MNLISDLHPQHRANAERQLREQRNPRTLPLGPEHYVEVDKSLASAAKQFEIKLIRQKTKQPTKMPAPANGYNPTVLTEWLRDHGIREPEYECKFHEKRRWRFDMAWHYEALAVEVQGGLFTNGAHVRGTALLREHDKLNEAAAIGWRILYRTPGNLMTAATAELIKRALM